jgi:hypothetical protein
MPKFLDNLKLKAKDTIDRARSRSPAPKTAGSAATQRTEVFLPFSHTLKPFADAWRSRPILLNLRPEPVNNT